MLWDLTNSFKETQEQSSVKVSMKENKKELWTSQAKTSKGCQTFHNFLWDLRINQTTSLILMKKQEHFYKANLEYQWRNQKVWKKRWRALTDPLSVVHFKKHSGLPWWACQQQVLPQEKSRILIDNTIMHWKWFVNGFTKTVWALKRYLNFIILVIQGFLSPIRIE